MVPLMVPGKVRCPRVRVMFNARILPGVVECEVSSNNHYQSDTFRLAVALNAQGGMTESQWGGDDLVGELFTIAAQIQPTDPWTDLITGEADKIKISKPDCTVHIEGRDLTSRMIEAKTQETFLNQTASEVAEKIAARHGLTPVVTPTRTLVSRYYTQDHSHLTQNQFSKSSTEWDLLAYLARNERYDLFVKGTELHFQPEAANPNVYGVTWDQASRQGNFITTTQERSLTLAKDVTVVVRSWNSRQGRGFTKTSGPGGAGSSIAHVSGRNFGKGKAKSEPQRYFYEFPNLTEDQAQKKADALRQDISRHERILDIHIPVELAATSRDKIALAGCGGTWDMEYFIASIHRSFEVDGTSETISCKNRSPDSEAAAPG